MKVELWSRNSGDDKALVKTELWSRSSGDDEAQVLTRKAVVGRAVHRFQRRLWSDDVSWKLMVRRRRGGPENDAPMVGDGENKGRPERRSRTSASVRGAFPGAG